MGGCQGSAATDGDPSRYYVTGIGMDPGSISMDIGGLTAILTPVITPSNADDRSVV
jgi:hypothetical protein